MRGAPWYQVLKNGFSLWFVLTWQIVLCELLCTVHFHQVKLEVGRGTVDCNTCTEYFILCAILTIFLLTNALYSLKNSNANLKQYRILCPISFYMQKCTKLVASYSSVFKFSYCTHIFFVVTSLVIVLTVINYEIVSFGVMKVWQAMDSKGRCCY
jgi:L-lactate permease